VDVLAVVPAQLLFLLRRPEPQRLRHIPVRIFAANHEADLTRWISWNGGVGILGNGEDRLAVLLELLDQGEMQPLVLSCWIDSVARSVKCLMYTQRENVTVAAKQGKGRRGLTTLSGNHTTVTECAKQQFKVWLLEKRFGGSFRVARVGYDDVEFVLPLLEELEAVADMDFDVGVFKSDSHPTKVFLGKSNHCLNAT
jgi:hypothetical protein